MWTNYRVSWMFLGKLCGSVPADPEIAKKWIEARQPSVRPPGARSINEIQEEVFSTIATEEPENEVSLLVFQRFNGGLVMRAATIKAHLKDCARVLSAQYIGSIDGERAFSTRVINGLYHDPAEYWVPILRPDGSPVVSADGTRDKAIHVRGPRGEQLNAIKTFEFIEPARMDFTIKVLTAKANAKKGKGAESKALPSVHLQDLETLFQYGGVHGYAGERGDGEGRYTYSIEEVK